MDSTPSPLKSKLRGYFQPYCLEYAPPASGHVPTGCNLHSNYNTSGALFIALSYRRETRLAILSSFQSGVV